MYVLRSRGAAGCSVALAAVLGGLVTLATACGPEAGAPPRLLLDRSVCERCSMLISEPAFAAAYRIDGQESLFDDLGCLLAELAGEPAGSGAEVWARDFETHEWLAAERATFVRSEAFFTPMGGGLVAVRSREAAEALAGSMGGRIEADFAELVREGGNAS